MKTISKIVCISVLISFVSPVFAAPALPVNQVRQQAVNRMASVAANIQKFTGRRAAVMQGILKSKEAVKLVVTKDGMDYSVTLDNTTQYRRRFWGKSTLDEMELNDSITVIGKWLDDDRTQIQAKMVRDLSIQKRNGTFFGKVTSISPLKLETVRGEQSVTLSSNVKMVNRSGATIQASAIVVGHRIRVKGLWNNQANIITEVTQVKDYDLPVRTTPTPKP